MKRITILVQGHDNREAKTATVYLSEEDLAKFPEASLEMAVASIERNLAEMLGIEVGT